jgi:hypothetical protein
MMGEWDGYYIKYDYYQSRSVRVSGISLNILMVCGTIGYKVGEGGFDWIHPSFKGYVKSPRLCL